MEEHIKKLNQLDRIEYRIRRLDIGQDLYFLAFSGGAVVLCTAIMLPILLILSLLNNNYEQMKDIIIAFLMFGVIIGSFLFLCAITLSTLRNKKLNKEYFDVVTKKK